MEIYKSDSVDIDAGVFVALGVICFLIGILMGAVFFYPLNISSGVTSALQAVIPCTKTSPLIQQKIDGHIWVCVDGHWKNVE